MRKNTHTLFTAILLASGIHTYAKTGLTRLQVEYTQTPLAVEVLSPRFSWQMTTDDNQRGCRQTAYEITVKDEQGKEVWHTGKVKDDGSLNISYAGDRLQPATRYTWTLNVWNQKKEKMTATSFFETGLAMTPNYNHAVTSLSDNGELKAWSGAKWIGRGENATIFYAPYLPVFRLHYEVRLDRKSQSTKAALLFGANDPRLMDKYKNLLGVENLRDSSYIKIELDIAPLAKKQEAMLHVYRKGYKTEEDGHKPIASFKIPPTLIHPTNRYDTHKVDIAVNAGQTDIYIDGSEKPVGKLILNPTGKRGGDYIAYPVVGDMGYAVPPRQKAVFSNITVKNFRNPQRVITTVLKDSLSLDGGKQGAFHIQALKENTAPMLRTVFTTPHKEIAKARLYATARGIYDLYLNGKSVSKAYFNPGSTQYDKSQTYQTFDVTSLLNQGTDNALGAILAEGWWSGGITYEPANWNLFGDRQSLLVKLQITYKDGTTQTVVSDPQTWKTFDDGPVRYGSFFQGEVYDARKEKAVEGWNTARYDDSHWKQAVEVKTNPDFKMANNFQLLSDMANPVMPTDTLTAKSMEEVRPGVYVYDFGQNMAGVPLLKFHDVRPDTKVNVRFAEIKYPDLPAYKEHKGMIMTENLRVAQSQDVYTTKGGEETFSPRYTYHGFRYLELTGVEKPLKTEDVKAIALSSMNGLRSHYEVSDSAVNRLWKNIVWSTRSNFLSIPTDCPQRNERLGWMGDISVFSRSATYLTDASQFLRRYLVSVRDLQSKNGKYPDVAPTGCGFGGLLWGSAGITVPWELYQQYDDKALLEEHYDSMKRYIQYVLKDCIDPKTNLIVQTRRWGDLGDWLSPVEKQDDKSLIWEAYFIFDLDLMTRMATVLDKGEDAQWFAELARQRRVFFHKTYLDAKTGQTHFSAFEPAREGKPVDTQTSYALPLAFNIGKHKEMAANLRRTVVEAKDNYPAYSLLTGFIGTAWISKALSDCGMTDVAYRLLLQDTYPSWLYPVKNGATTVWERLNSYTVKDGFGKNNSMNSFNHYSFGAVAAWMYNYSLGIRRDEKHPGFKHFILKPEADPTGRLRFAKGYYDSMYGRIESQWMRKGDYTEYQFTVPANTSATLYLPASSVKHVKLDGKKLRNSEMRFDEEKGYGQMELVSGRYSFTVDKE